MGAAIAVVVGLVSVPTAAAVKAQALRMLDDPKAELRLKRSFKSLLEVSRAENLKVERKIKLAKKTS